MPTMFITRVGWIRAPTAPIERDSPLTAPILCSSASGSAALVGVSLDEARSDHETLPIARSARSRHLGRRTFLLLELF
jgi:hypothetical protein